jgi:hypothetical protein
VIDRSLFTLDRLLDQMLDTVHGSRNYWWHLAEIVPAFMPPYPREDTRPTCVVRVRGSFLRYSVGPRQGFFWDMYGDNFHTPELALLALLQAPVPPPLIDKEAWRQAHDAAQTKEQT